MPQRTSRGQPDAALATNTYWRSLSDEELLRISFTTADPESLASLVQDVPDTTGAPPIVEYAYDFRGTKRTFIRCAHCRYPNHLAGYVVKTQDGSRFLVGHDCGDKIYGADFAGFRRDYDNARSDAEDLKRWLNLQAAFPAFFGYLTELQKSAAVRAFRDTHTMFRQNFPRLFGAIAGAFVHQNGSLYLDEQIRDFAAEERAETRFDREMAEWTKLTSTERKRRRGEEPRMPKLPLYKSIPKMIMVLRAQVFFSDRPILPHQELDLILRGFGALSAEISGTSLKRAAWEGRKDQAPKNLYGRHRFATTFRETFNQTNTLLDKIEQQLVSLANFAAFFDPAALAMVAQWANEHPAIRANVVVRGKGLVAEYDPNVSVSLPAGFTLPDRTQLDAFRRAVNSTTLQTADTATVP